MAATMTWITASPRDPATGAVTTVRLAGGGTSTPYRKDGQHYRAGVVRRPRFTAKLDFGDNGWTGGTLPTTGKLTFRPAGFRSEASGGTGSVEDVQLALRPRSRRNSSQSRGGDSLAGKVSRLRAAGGDAGAFAADGRSDGE